jgi:hypothetical protein
MNPLGSFNPGDLVTDKFTTTNLSGAPVSIAGGGEIAIYAGQSTSAIRAGVTLVVDFAGAPGVNQWRVDTAADPAVYVTVAQTSAANQFTVQLESGLVAGFPVRGYQVGKFTLGPQGSVTGVSGSVGSVQGSVGSVTGAVGSVTGNVGGSVGSVAGNVTGQVLGGVSGSVGFVQGAVASVTGAVGSVAGNLGGNVLGQVVGGVSGNITGQVVGGVSGSIGFVQGAVGSVTGAVGSVTGNVGGNVVGSVGSVTAPVAVSGPVGLQASSIKTETIEPAAFDATVFAAEFLLGDSGSAAFYNAIADAYLDRADGIETGMTPRQAQRGIAATAMGLLSGAGTSNIGIRQAGTGTATRISAVVDQSGNRSAVTRNL